MQESYLQFQIQQLRQMNTTRVMESIMVLLLSVVVASMGPSLLMRLMFGAQPALGTQPPQWLIDLPMYSFGVGIAYVLFTILGNLFRSNKANRLESELKTIHLMADSSSFASTDEELAALEKIVDNALEEHETAKNPKKKATKKSKK